MTLDGAIVNLSHKLSWYIPIYLKIIETLWYLQDNKIKDINESLSKVVKAEIDISYANQQEYDIDTVKQALENKHMPKNRLKTLCSQVSDFKRFFLPAGIPDLLNA